MQTWHECNVFFSATAKWSEANNKMFDFNVYVLLFFSLRIFMLFCSISHHHCRWDVGVHSMRRLQVKDYQNFCFLLCKFLFKVCYKHLMIQTVAQLLVCWLFSWLSVKWYIVLCFRTSLIISNYFHCGWMKFSQIKLKTWLSSWVLSEICRHTFITSQVLKAFEVSGHYIGVSLPVMVCACKCFSAPYPPPPASLW